MIKENLHFAEGTAVANVTSYISADFDSEETSRKKGKRKLQQGILSAAIDLVSKNSSYIGHLSDGTNIANQQQQAHNPLGQVAPPGTQAKYVLDELTNRSRSQEKQPDIVCVYKRRKNDC